MKRVERWTDSGLTANESCMLYKRLHRALFRIPDGGSASGPALRIDEAAKLLRDLRTLDGGGATSGQSRRGCEARIEQLCAEHERKPGFVRRVRDALAGR